MEFFRSPLMWAYILSISHHRPGVWL